MDKDVEVIARAARVLAEEASLVGLLDGALKDCCLVVELATDIDVCCCALCDVLSANA